MYGRTTDLERLNADRNNPKLTKLVRRRANEAHHKIVEQMKDRKLMGMREQLINATQAGDLEAAGKIQMRMRAYLKQDQETGI